MSKTLKCTLIKKTKKNNTKYTQGHSPSTQKQLKGFILPKHGEGGDEGANIRKLFQLAPTANSLAPQGNVNCQY